STRKARFLLPSFIREVNSSMHALNGTSSRAKLAPEVTSASASQVQRFLPVRVSTQWKVPSSSLAMTASSRKATGGLNAFPPGRVGGGARTHVTQAFPLAWAVDLVAVGAAGHRAPQSVAAAVSLRGEEVDVAEVACLDDADGRSAVPSSRWRPCGRLSCRRPHRQPWRCQREGAGSWKVCEAVVNPAATAWPYRRTARSR